MSKINQLINKWPRGTVATASYLKRQGFTYDLLTKYRRSGWIRSFGQGAYTLPEDRVEWPGALYAVQSQLELKVHAGGKTALELKGYGHYVPEETKTLFLYAQPRVILPAWFSGERLGLSLVVTRTSLFPGDTLEAFSEWKEREFSIRISSPGAGGHGDALPRPGEGQLRGVTSHHGEPCYVQARDCSKASGNMPVCQS